VKRRDALNVIVSSVSKEDAIVSTMGLMSRELYDMHDSPQNFYMVGSMGLASSIGLGIAVSQKYRKVIVIDGDGNLLMNLGSLATIGYIAPSNLTHIVLDNCAYASCSEEPSISHSARLAQIARTAGYSSVHSADNEQQLQETIKATSYEKGPIFILANIELGGRRDLPRILELERMKTRFRNFLHEKTNEIQ